MPAHSHGFVDKYLSDSGEGDYDNEESDNQDGQYVNEGKSTDQEPAKNLLVGFGLASYIDPNTSGGGAEQGLGDGPHDHMFTLSGGVSISNTTHTHNINFTIPTIPPYYALTFIYKL